MEGIEKRFPGVRVLKGVDFDVRAGEVHALMGENGAGKSTLIKVLGGIFPRDAGKIFIGGEERSMCSPREAVALGVGIIHQELNLVPQLSVMENLFLGREHTFSRGFRVGWRRMREEALRWMEKLGVTLDPACKVGDLSVGQRQMVEIAKALSLKARILVMDEPTAALAQREIESLFRVIASLKEQGVGMVYISHRMEEIFQMCDRITVLRDGENVGTRDTGKTDMEELVRMMVGREIRERFPRESVPPGEERLRVKGLTRRGKVKGVSFAIRAGEILGMAGLMGAGRTETANLLFGVEKPDGGSVLVDGEPIRIRRPEDAIRAGFAYVTEDRKGEGLVLSRSVKENLMLPHLPALSLGGVIRRRQEQKASRELIKSLSIHTVGVEQKAGFLSGGNQQKVAIGKWLTGRPKVFILDEPTRGIDIGARAEIYRLMNRLTQEGIAILLISSDLPEVLGMSDRLLVMHEGRIVAEYQRGEADQEAVVQAASGGGKQRANRNQTP
ncbi:sugar ABC transporter ATP-binding protein [Salinithrix halophila]|uniref:Sugar ABC transporter ATP-binding protein n=1 Tax=Salinithrix halophila TaxID=1485204 RepID=A0ABV8JAL4_9BACL